MKKIITVLLVQILVTVQIFSQTPKTLISGSIVEDKKKPVEAATISLMKKADSSLFHISVTDKYGKFSFQDIPCGSYYINVSVLNYPEFNSKIFELKEASLTKDIDVIVLQKEASVLALLK
ncbi:MAG: carboxypeptidase-like regulatory domain-containing protein [Ferruginibacter sp.]